MEILFWFRIPVEDVKVNLGSHFHFLNLPCMQHISCGCAKRSIFVAVKSISSCTEVMTDFISEFNSSCAPTAEQFSTYLEFVDIVVGVDNDASSAFSACCSRCCCITGFITRSDDQPDL